MKVTRLELKIQGMGYAVVVAPVIVPEWVDMLALMERAVHGVLDELRRFEGTAPREGGAG